jgi:hypothetical protein
MEVRQAWCHLSVVSIERRHAVPVLTESAPQPGPCTIAQFAPEPEDPLGKDMIAVSPPRPETHAVVIAHHTLPLVLTLMRKGCAAVTGLRMGARSPDVEPADLAWIADPLSDGELYDALDAACQRMTSLGRVVLDVTVLARAGGLTAVYRRIESFGLRIVTVGETSDRPILVAMRATAMACAA